MTVCSNIEREDKEHPSYHTHFYKTVMRLNFFYGDLVYKLGRVKGTAKFVSSDSKVVKLLRHQKYDPVMIEKMTDLVLGPSTAFMELSTEKCI